MTTYNFKVRAKDDTGAYADRSFAINVRNTSVESLVAIDGTDAYSSADGVTWTKRIGQGGTRVSHGNGRWIVTGASGTYKTSTDGVNWVAGQFLTYTGASLVNYLNGRWVAAIISATSTMTVLTSTDGLSWTVGGSMTVQASSTPMTSAYGNGKYCVALATSNTIYACYSSPDLATFTAVTIPNTTTSGNDIIYVNGLWVLIGRSPTAPTIYTSPNLTTWTQRTFPALGTSNFLNTLVYGNGRIVCTISRNSGSPLSSVGTYLTSDDGGITWTLRTMATPFIASTLSVVAVNVCFDGTWYFCSTLVDVAGKGLRTSRDAITTAVRTVPTSSTGQFVSIARAAT